MLAKPVVEIAPRTWLISEYKLVNMYLLEGDEAALLIDCGTGIGNAAETVRELTDKPLTVAITHGHFDHDGAAALFPEIHLHPMDIKLSEEGYARGEEARAWYAKSRGPVRNPEATEEERLASFRDIPAENSYFVYFYMPACDDCEKVQTYLANMDKEFALEQNRLSKLQVNYVNMGDLDNVPLAHWFFDQYGVPEERQKAPVMFYQNGYLQGYEEIVANMPNLIMNGKALNWQDIDYVPKDQDMSFGWKDWIFLVFTGVVNGLSPCGISLLLLLFSLLLSKHANVLKLGLTFIVARFLTFLLLGTVLYSAFEQISAVLEPVGRILQILIILLSIVFAVLNFIDFFMARKNEYGKIRFQLPPKLRAFQRNYLENTLNCGGKYLTGTVFIAGIVLSVGEFLCTGQLYLASILYMMQRQTAWDFIVVLEFVVYLLAMSLPLLLLTVLAKRGSQVLQLSEMTRGKLPWIKLLYGVLFLLFAVLLFLFMR